MIRKLLIAGIVMVPVAALAGSSSPPPPQPVTCAGGNAVTALGYGIATTCGSPIAGGTINNGAAPQIGQYTALNTIGPATVSGDCTIAAGGAITCTAINGKALTLGGALTTTGSGAITFALGNSTATLTFQGTDTYVGRATTDTLTNKTLTSPILVTPALGTPASGVATNLTGLPISTGISGFGTGVATALAVNVGSAGAPVVLNGALGTPSSGTLTNATGLPIAGITGLGTGVGTALGNNLSANAGLTKTVFSGAKAMGTSAISSAACATLVTDTATGTLTTDVVLASFNGDPTAVTGYVPATTGMLTIITYPTADTVNFKVCNNTSSSITPGAITLNWRVVR